jgi:Flavodoxin-like fold
VCDSAGTLSPTHPGPARALSDLLKNGSKTPVDLERRSRRTTTVPKKITIIQGHPDPEACHFGHSLADSYATGAAIAGHEVRHIEVAQLDFSMLRNQASWNSGPPPATLLEAQAAIRWADPGDNFSPMARNHARPAQGIP